MIWVYVAIIVIGVGVLVVIPVVYLIVQTQRAKRQRVTLKHGTLSITDSATGVLTGFPVDRIGAVILLPARDRLSIWRGEPSQGIWTWGGLLILDTTGRVVRHLVHIPGTDLPLARIAQDIPAPIHGELSAEGNGPYSRRQLLKQYPHALRFTQLRGGTWWAVLITLLCVVGLPFLIAAIAFIVILVTVALQG